MSRASCPALSALLLAHGPLEFAFFVSSILSAGALPFLLRVRGVQRNAGSEHESFTSQILAGLQYAQTHTGIRLIFGYTILNGMLGRSTVELLPGISGSLLNGDAQTLAVLTAAAACGAILAGIIVSRFGSDESKLLALVSIALAMSCLCLLIFSIFNSLPGFSALIMLLACATTCASMGCQTLTQLLISEQFRGRVISLWTTLAMGVPAIGAMLMGGLADILSFPPVLTGFSILGAACVAILYKKRYTLTSSKSRQNH